MKDGDSDAQLATGRPTGGMQESPNDIEMSGTEEQQRTDHDRKGGPFGDTGRLYSLCETRKMPQMLIDLMPQLC